MTPFFKSPIHTEFLSSCCEMWTGSRVAEAMPRAVAKTLIEILAAVGRFVFGGSEDSPVVRCLSMDLYDKYNIENTLTLHIILSYSFWIHTNVTMEIKEQLTKILAAAGELNNEVVKVKDCELIVVDMVGYGSKLVNKIKI
ncbi:hypothetical protein JTE90_026750 [Oedothorax gibbosus]|uniref:Uncharacterized protein n=1 Tax=Oedothorax gibbosus TaxID=931172 RepID=A0AAV6TSF4_9ARAC|nr:hypothetical protein JTE90_026750 [Oedothorax gibbosus]